MGISGSELVVLLLVGFLVVGPEKLPELSRQLARVIRKVVAVARDTGDKVRAELGDDFEELKDLDPRQYDPRRIVADAMKQPAPRAWPAASTAARATAGAPAGLAAGSAAASASAGAAMSAGATASVTPAATGRPDDRFDGSVPAPFDPDAT